MANKTISPVLSLDDDGKASILFVLPCLRRPGVEKILEEPSSQQFFKVISKVIKSYACITIKPDVGTWSDDETEAKIKENEHRIADAVGEYKPKCVVVLGGNLAKMLIPEIRKSKYDLRGTFSNYRMTNRKNIMAMIWGTPDRVINDYQEYVRMPETLAKLSMFAKNKKYHNLPIIHNLDTFKAAKEYLDFLANEHTGIIGFDTETYSLNRVHNTRLGSMQFCHDDKEAYVLLWDSKHQKLTQQERNKLVPSITNLFGSKDTKFEAWTMHNAEFDIMQMFAEFKTRTYKPIFDTMLFAHLMDENRKQTARVWIPDNGPYSLKTLVQEFLAFFHYSDEAMKARSSGSIMDLPLEPFLEYSGSDPIVTYRLFHVFKAWAKLEKYNETVLRLMRCLHSRALKMYADVSRTGVLVDKDNLKLTMSKESVINKRLFEISETYKTIPEIQAVNREIAEGMADTSMFFKVPWVFDMNKPSHRNVLFFHSRKGFKFPANEDGKFSSDKKFQKKYASANKAVELFQESQGLVKLRNSYVKPIFDALLRNPDAKSDICDGRVHPQFHLGRTVTGRTASSNPNAQQVPRSDSPVKKGIKAMFIPSPGKILIQADLSAAEVRVWGALSGDTRICQLSRDALKLRAAVRENPNDKKLRDEAELKADFHKQTYGLCFNKSPSDVTKTERQDAKKLSFGMMYGMSDAGLAREIGKEMDEVMDIKSRFFGVYEVGSAWFGKTQEFALENGYIQTPLGRRRRMPQVFSGDKGLISEAKRFAVNAPIQATASDYAMLAVSILHEYIIDNNLEEHMKILLTVHDSVVLEVTETAEWVQFASKLVRRVFTKDVVKVLKRDFDFELLAPIDIDIEVSQQYIHSCPKCGNKQYIGEGNICKGTIKTGEKKPDGSAATVQCDCTDLKVQKVGGGWGWLMGLEENAQGVAKAMKGIKIEQPKRKSEKSKMAAHK